MRRFLLHSLVVLLLLAPLVSAQSALGLIQGRVVDRSGAPLPGATLTLACAGATPREIVIRSGADGAYVFRQVPPGQCVLSVTLPGFQTTKWEGRVQTGTTLSLPFTLHIVGLDEKLASRQQRQRGVPLPPVPVPSPPPSQGVVAPVPAGASVEGGIKGGVAGGIVGGLAAGVGGGTGGGSYSPLAERPFNTEAYDKVDDNQWTAVSNRPLSTFSTDVDTASYANVRRFLNAGQLPPKDAVRIEELINYFSYDYAAPQASAPFAVATALGDAPWNPRHRLALIGLQARKLDTANAPPRNLVFLVDVSGSMEMPQKLPLVKASLTMLARNLRASDRIAVVVYAGAAGLVLPSTSGADTSTIVEALGRLRAGGSTNGASGITLAYQVARAHFIQGGVNRVVLATDGDFNVGVTNQGDLIRLIEGNRDHGVALSVLGFGMGNLKDSTMEKLADRGNGNYSYIDTLSEAQKVLVEEAGGTLVTIAKDVKLQVEFTPRVVAAYRLIGYENRVLADRDFNDDKKDAGDIGAGHSVTALYELVPVGEKIDMPDVDPLKYQRPPSSGSADRNEALTVKVRYKAPEASESTLMTVPVANHTANADALGFPAAVAEFGMLLRDSEFKGASSYADAAALAARFKGQDNHGHRAEFIRLLGIADGLSRLATVGDRRE